MTRRRYRFAGLLFESTLDLPEWKAFACRKDGAPDVRIVVGDEAHVPPRQAQPQFGESEDYRLSVPAVGTFRIVSGERIVVLPASGVDPGELRVFLLGSALAALCCQRGLLLLHASVVRVATRTVALCGPAGSGKSTLAAALVDEGASFVCDDLARFDVREGRPVVYPSTPRLKLSPAAVDTLGWPAHRLTRVHGRATKFQVPQAHRDPWSPVPLDAICLLEWTDGPVTVRPLRGLRALRGLITAATYRPRLLERMDREAAHWQQCAALAAGTRIYELRRPRTWGAMRGVIDAIGGLA